MRCGLFKLLLWPGIFRNHFVFLHLFASALEQHNDNSNSNSAIAFQALFSHANRSLGHRFRLSSALCQRNQRQSAAGDFARSSARQRDSFAPALLPVRATCPPARLRRLRVLGPQPTLITEDCEESDFDGERFLNIAIQMIAQFFEAAHALQNFDGAETFREHA